MAKSPPPSFHNFPSRYFYPAADSASTLRLFYITLVFFLVLQGYGILFYKLRVQFDLSNNLVYHSWYRFHFDAIPMYRYSFMLNKFLIPVAVWLHLPLSEVGRMYCINDALFYLIVSLLIILLTKKYEYAAAVLAAPVLITNLGFYFLENELFLSGALMIFYVSIYQYYKHGWPKKMMLAVSAFFIIWSHPITLIALLIFMLYLYRSTVQIKQDLLLLTFIGINVLLRALLLSHYDYEKIQALNLMEIASGPLSTFSDYFVKLLLFLLSFYFLIRISASNAGIVLKFAGLFVCIPFCYSTYNNEFDWNQVDIIKRLYPLHLFLLMLGLSWAGKIRLRPGHVMAIYILYLTMGITNILSSYTSMNNRVTIIEKLNALCQKQDALQSKWYVKEDVFLPIDLFQIKWHTATMVFSAIDKQCPTIQLVRGSPEDLEQLKRVPVNELFLNKHSRAAITQFDPYYFNFSASVYKELILDTAEINALKKSDVHRTQIDDFYVFSVLRNFLHKSLRLY